MNGSSPRGPETQTMAGCTGGRKCFGPDGCPAVANGRRCGETRNLQIIQEFRRLYEDKMKQIDDAAGGDCVQAKISLQQEWIRDLTDQNEMLVRVVEELEVEAAERVTMLEDKLEQSANCACEVMESYKDISINFLPDFQKMEYLQNDLNNIVELLKRVRNDGVWSKEGLTFYTVNIDNLFDCSGAILNKKDNKELYDCNCNWNGDRPPTCKHEKLANERLKQVKELEEQVYKLNDIAEKHEDSKKTCQDLRKSMLDMRDALTAEVAEKHDLILCLRREVHLLEEQCKKAEQQTHFKDDIIKEMRKEIKQFKIQADQEKTQVIQKLTQENHQFYEDLKLAKAHVERMRSELLKRKAPIQEKVCTHRANQTRPSIQFKHCQTTTVEVVGESSLENMISEKETERKLVVHLEREVQGILYEMKGKDKQLHDQKDLITLLVQKMFSLYKVLRSLYENSLVMLEDLDSHCYCGVDGITLVVQEKYKEIIDVLQDGIRKSLSGIEDENEM